MKRETKRTFWAAVCLLAAFALWTAAVCVVDVQAIGPQGAEVGFAAVNRWFHHWTGVQMALYTVTDWLSLIPVGFGAGFALLGLGQWIRRRSLRMVDRSILILGGFYVVMAAVYLLFEGIVINYRPILIDGVLEASYPSSTTVLVLCVMSTAILQLKKRIRSEGLRRGVVSAMTGFTAFMVVCRMLSGVHWLTDIVGGALFSGGLVLLYAALTDE